MLDVYMILLLVCMFLIFTGFMNWCDRVVEDTGGDPS